MSLVSRLTIFGNGVEPTLRQWHCRWLARALCGFVVLAIASTPSIAVEDPPPLDMQAKLLLKVIPFINWPAPIARERSVTVCVTGDNPFGALLDGVAALQPPGSPKVTIRPLTEKESPVECQILYVGGKPTAASAEVLAAAEGHPILTITDSMPLAAPRGIINFVPASDRAPLEIDVGGAERNHLDISSKLLSIAAGVRPPE